MTAPMVRSQGVHKNFGALKVLKGIDLEVQQGQVFCLVGPSGSGKSTFLRCINHLEKVDAGKLSVDGHLVGYRQAGDKLYELREKEVAAKRADIGMVFQRFNLFPHMTALGNIAEAPIRVKGESRADAVDRARQLRRVAVLAVGEPDLAQQLARVRVRLVLAAPTHDHRRAADVLDRR
ncbi:MAG: polar amino acid transport system ATP-binding protein, partial [Frankiales bacterium]|nr:polar amino acid transport system ATP-binding protein [Frankiales bacterium]